MHGVDVRADVLEKPVSSAGGGRAHVGWCLLGKVLGHVTPRVAQICRSCIHIGGHGCNADVKKVAASMFGQLQAPLVVKVDEGKEGKELALGKTLGTAPTSVDIFWLLVCSDLLGGGELKKPAMRAVARAGGGEEQRRNRCFDAKDQACNLGHEHVDNRVNPAAKNLSVLED